MTGVVPYLLFDGEARAALAYYAEVFGGEHWSSDAEGRIGHGEVRGPVRLFVADTEPGRPAWRLEGGFLALLGAAAPEVLARWFAALAEGGAVLAPLEPQPWGDHEGRVTDRFGVTWLIGWEGSSAAGP